MYRVLTWDPAGKTKLELQTFLNENILPTERIAAVMETVRPIRVILEPR